VVQLHWATWSRWIGVAHFAVFSPQDTFVCETCSTGKESLKSEKSYHFVQREQKCWATLKQQDILKVVFGEQDRRAVCFLLTCIVWEVPGACWDIGL
jgi:hypothetical protein